MAYTIDRCEESTTFSPIVVDREHGVLKNVKILGSVSKNGRRYLPEAMRNGFHLYEGVIVNTNHDRVNHTDRNVEDRIGRIVNVRYVEGDGIFGDFEILTSHPMSERVMEAAERMPSAMGFSHLADCARRKAGGIDEVIAIRKVYSVDLVGNPATTSSMYESEGNETKSHEKKEMMCEKCCKMNEIKESKDKKYSEKLKLMAEEYGMSDDSSDSSGGGDSGGEKGSSTTIESCDPEPLKESAEMPEPVEKVESKPAVSAVAETVVESVEPKVVGTPLNEVQDLCAAAGVVFESTMLDTLTKLPKSEIIPVIRRVALAESVSKPVTSNPVSAADAGRIPEKNLAAWLRS